MVLSPRQASFGGKERSGSERNLSDGSGDGYCGTALVHQTNLGTSGLWKAWVNVSVHPVAFNAVADIAGTLPDAGADGDHNPASRSLLATREEAPTDASESLNITTHQTASGKSLRRRLASRVLWSSDRSAQSIYLSEGQAQTKFKQLHIWQASSKWLSRITWFLIWGPSIQPPEAPALLSYRNFPAGVVLRCRHCFRAIVTTRERHCRHTMVKQDVMPA